MSLPAGEAPFDCVEVRFKNSRKEYFRNAEGFPLQIGDLVASQAASGHDLGMVTLTGSLVKVQMKKKKVSFTGDDLPKIYRKATEKDIAIWQRCRDREEEIKKADSSSVAGRTRTAMACVLRPRPHEHRSWMPDK